MGRDKKHGLQASQMLKIFFFSLLGAFVVVVAAFLILWKFLSGFFIIVAGLIASCIFAAAWVFLTIYARRKKNKPVFIVSIIAAVLFVIIFGLFLFGRTYFEIKHNEMYKDDIKIGSISSYVAPSQDQSPNVDVVDGEFDELSEPPFTPEQMVDITPEVIKSNVEIAKKDRISKDVINILIMGISAGESANGDGLSDSMMVFSYNYKTNTVWIFSVLRDSFVPIEGHGWDKINSAYPIGGVGLAINTVNSIFDLDIQNYVTLDFDALVEIVDKLGGVKVPITKEEAAHYRTVHNNHCAGPAFNVSSGDEVLLTGLQALRHARNRCLAGTDFERARRQRDIMQAIYRRILEKKDAGVMLDIVNTSLGLMKTNLDKETIINLTKYALFNGTQPYVGTRNIPEKDTWEYATYGNRAITKLDINENKNILKFFLYDEWRGKQYKGKSGVVYEEIPEEDNLAN